MSEKEKNLEGKGQPGDHIGKLVDIFENWFEYDFLNKPAHIYLEAVYYYACKKIDNGECTAEQEEFLVECLQEARNFKNPSIIFDYDWE
jgi:hypothetical protein